MVKYYMKKRLNKYIEEYEEWFMKAESDLRSAEIIFREEDPPTDTICFLLQQAVEKYLKGFLLFHKDKYPLIHNLPELLKSCKKYDEYIWDYLEECEVLNGFYIETRYPSATPWKYSKTDTKKAFDMAYGLIKYIKRDIQ